jgi:arginyl-tRNA synthetase
MSFVLVRESIKKALKEIEPDFENFSVEYPTDITFGDYSSNVAMVLAKKMDKNPKILAGEIVEKIKEQKSEIFEKVEVAGPGFINFYLSNKYFNGVLEEILEKEDDFGKNDKYKNQKVMVEYTDPNPFKVFHIGHLMSNAIGESISRIIENAGAKVVRACWQGDVGLHVAKAIWGMKEKIKNESASRRIDIKDLGVKEWGEAYVLGSERYENDELIKNQINLFNKEIFDKSNQDLNVLYDAGRKISLDHFEEIYKKLDTHFDHYFFEGTEGRDGLKIVENNLGKVFEKSEGAIVFKGENYNLHTRVFVNSAGLPTYETKELGLNKAKFEKEKDLARSIIVTGNEQNDYFKVLLKVIEIIFPEIGKKTEHIGHGMLQFATGKMSSRKGNVITGESLIEDVEEMVAEKIKDSNFNPEEKDKIKTAVAVGAIKYSILKQSIGGNIIFDFKKSVSFEGDSGPYLQYSYARANSVLEKGKDFGFKDDDKVLSEECLAVARFLERFTEVTKRAEEEMEPHHVVTYLVQLAGLFNNFYAHNQVVDSGDKEKTKERLSIVKAFSVVMKNGLKLLAIPVLEKM